MSAPIEPLDFNPSVVLFRRAKVAAIRARETAEGNGAWTANPKAREADDCIIALVLAHAAVETAWHWEQLAAGVSPHKWPAEFEAAIAAVAAARGRPIPAPMGAALRERGLNLSAWRNFLQHGDAKARTRLAGGALDVPAALSAALAEEAIEAVRLLGDYMFSATGGQRAFDSNWVDPAEL